MLNGLVVYDRMQPFPHRLITSSLSTALEHVGVLLGGKKLHRAWPQTCSKPLFRLGGVTQNHRPTSFRRFSRNADHRSAPRTSQALLHAFSPLRHDASTHTVVSARRMNGDIPNRISIKPLIQALTPRGSRDSNDEDYRHFIDTLVAGA